MAREDEVPQWLMGALAGQDAYRGDAAFPPPPPTGIRTGALPRSFEDYLGEATKPRSVLRTGVAPRSYDDYLAEAIKRPVPPLPEDDTWLNQAKAGALSGLALLNSGPSTLMEQTVGDPEAEVREKRKGMLERGAEAVPKPEDILGYIFRQGGEAAVNPWNYSAGIPLGAAWTGASGLGAGLAGYAAKDTPYEMVAQLAGGLTPPQAVTGAVRGVGRLAGAGLDLMPAGALGALGGTGGRRRGGPLPRSEADFAPNPRARIGGNQPPMEAQFSQYAEAYPPVGPPELRTDPKTGKEFPGKLLLPEAEDFKKARAKIAADMAKRGFDPFFDPAKRGLVDYTKYPLAVANTSTVVPKREDKIKEYSDVIKTPEVRARLEAAVKRGEELGNANDWYFMSQLEGQYIKELGAKEGRKAFADEFAAPMAATTAGQDPTGNLLMSHYLEYQRKRGDQIPTEGYDLPTPVGGRYAENNLRSYRMMREGGGYAGLGVDQPKMYDFSRSMVGDLRNPVMDEQMSEGMLAGVPSKTINNARKIAYGYLQEPVRELAADRGVLPGAIQDVAWAGFKNEPGKPMIQIVNEAIERTHRLTGMPREEIVRRGLVRKEIPLYGLGGVATMGAIADQGRLREE